MGAGVAWNRHRDRAAVTSFGPSVLRGGRIIKTAGAGGFAHSLNRETCVNGVPEPRIYFSHPIDELS